MCWGLKLPKVVLVYVYPVNGGIYESNASRFANSIKSNPSDYDYELCVVSNGGPPSQTMKAKFSGLNCRFIEHDNSGWDIGAFQMASRMFPCEIMVFLGSSAYVVRPGWLGRMMEATFRHGWAIYGTTANSGFPPHGVHPHIRTTGFWCAPELVSSYPFPVTQGGKHERYAFEHGETNITNWAERNGAKAIMVTWNGEYPRGQWDNTPEGFRNGRQSAVIIRDRVCDPPYWSSL